MVMRISKNRVDLDDKELQRPVLKDYGEALVTSNSGSNYTIDLEHGNVHDITLTANCAFTFANPPASGTAGSFKLILTQDGTGGRTVTWPAAVAWIRGSAPTLSGDPGAIIMLTFITLDGGTTWHGLVIAASGGSVDSADLADEAVTYDKMQHVSATSRVLGRNSAGAGDVEEVTLSELLDFIGSAAEGDILYRGASSWQRLAAGSNDQVLTLASGVPTWADAGGGITASSYGSNGYVQFSDGFIIQWVEVSAETSYTWPIAFPNAVLAIFGDQRRDSSFLVWTQGGGEFHANSLTASGITVDRIDRDRGIIVAIGH